MGELGKESYEKARRKGLRTVMRYKANGWNAYLPALDSIISRDEILSEVSLGLMEIPINKIKGTKTTGRSSAFAPDFMPILDHNTEFGGKWESLCEAHYDEGIRDPIKVYEYLNWFYVEEGNKRVSVLKFCEATLVAANVTRVIPKYDKDDERIKLYYEFLEFYQKTHMNFIYFTELGSFVKMYKWIEKYSWQLPENEGEFRSIYYQFRKAYHKLGGKVLPITTGDALLKYLEVYPLYKADETIEANLKKMWLVLEAVGTSEAVEIADSPGELEKKGLFGGLTSFNQGVKSPKIAFINAETPQTSGWTYAHEIGRLHIESVFKDAIKTVGIYQVPEDETAYDFIRKAVLDGADIIFSTSPAFIHATLKASMEFTDVKFLSCSENLSYKQMRTYFGRIYEPNFLVGMIAGAMTKTNQLGYVVTYPIPEVITSINAYTLGARFVNPYAEVFVKWVEDASVHNKDACYHVDQQLMDMGVDIISHQESSDLDTLLNQSGIYFANELAEKDGKHTFLAVPIWNWGVFYEKLVRNIMNGNYSRINGLLGSTDRAISYWWGMDAGVVDFLYSKSKIPQPLVQTVEYMKKNIISGVFHPFYGPIYDQKGNLRIEENTHLTNTEVLSMDWFVQGVNGSIPSINAREESHPLFELFSVKKKFK